MPWRKARFRDAVVLARTDAQGNFVASDGRVEIRFREGDARAYRAGVRNLSAIDDAPLLPDDACPEAQEPAATRGRGGQGAAKTAGAATASRPVPEDAIVIYADGACSGNPGPAGVGVVLIDGKRRRELSHFLGDATNNIAELTAIELAVEAVADTGRAVRMHTDSQYAIGVLTKGWKAKANVELVARVRQKLARLRDVELRYVPGHTGVVLNERADTLAVQAVSERKSSGWVEL